MPNYYRKSFLTVLATLFLLPIFFIPGSVLDAANAKALILALGSLVAITLFLFAFYHKREVVLPKHHLIFVALLLPVAYLLSALLSTPSSLSLFGYNLEVGTFSFILLGVSLLILLAMIISNGTQVLELLLALFGAFSILAIFMVVKILSGGNLLVLGNFAGNMGNPLGSWTDLAVAFGLLSSLSVIAIGVLPMRGLFKALLYVAFALALILLVVIHFNPALALTLSASIFFLIYFRRVESGFYVEHGGKMEANKSFLSSPVLLSIILGVVSLLFLINPVVSQGRKLSEVVSGYFNVSNTEIHPTLATTLSISKAVLAERSLFGSGPNTFTHDWLIYKPSNVNSTPFWAVEFPFGAGFIPTQIAVTGVIGSIVWLAFFVLLLWLVLKALSHIPESRTLRFATVSAVLVTLFVWVGSFLYTPSLAMLMIGFIFTGALLALGRIGGSLSSYTNNFAQPSIRHLSTILILVVFAGVAYLGWVECGRTLAALHFERAVALSNTAGTPVSSIESELQKAITFAPLDGYYLGLSQLNFVKAQTVANSATGTPEQNRAVFEDALGKSISAARAAIDANPAAYGNWVALGNLYSALVPEPLKIDGAYESAQFAYNEAFKRNPANPGLPLMLAQLEINKGNLDQARSYIRSSLALKDDYPDAYILLARLEASAKNIPAAIASAEKLATLSPDNAGLYFEIGVLKYSISDYKGAAEVLTRALQLNASYANAKYYLALSVAKLGRKDEARTMLEELLTMNPDSAELQAALKDVSKK